MDAIESLQSKLASFPRLPLADYPTPLEPLPRLSEMLGRAVFMKRDDEIGPGLGGNKTRKLEYLLAEAQRRGAKRVVTFGGLQSNHVRITTAAVRKLGMEPHIFFFERRPDKLAGNLLLNELFGARMHFIPFGGGDGGMTLESTIRLVHVLAWALVGSHYFIPVGGHSWLGCLGYVSAALEIETQARKQGVENAHLVVAAGSGGTMAGLMAGMHLDSSDMQLTGIDVGKLWKGFPASIARLASEICSHLEQPYHFSPSQVPLIEGTYVGKGYAIPTAGCQEAISRLAQAEGILLDPVYTGKAFAGLLDLIQGGKLGKKEAVIFLHTGGLPALFAFEHHA